jgi:hypothetical protein
LPRSLALHHVSFSLSSVASHAHLTVREKKYKDSTKTEKGAFAKTGCNAIKDDFFWAYRAVSRYQTGETEKNSPA